MKVSLDRHNPHIAVITIENTAKMNADERMEHVPALKRAASQAGAGHGLSCCICVFGCTINFWNLCSRNVL